MLSADGLIDGSYDVTVHVTDMNIEKSIRVRGDVHVGGLMLRISNALNACPFDWSDHAVWWPAKNIWLLRTRRTLDQYDVPAGAILWFTPMHRSIRINFPDLQLIPVRVNFSANVFNNVISICKQFGIRHPEELSVLRANALKCENKSVKVARRPVSYSVNPSAQSIDTCSVTLDRSDTASIDSATADVMLGRSVMSLFDANDSSFTGGGSFRGSRDQISSAILPSLATSPQVSARDVSGLHVSTKPQTYADKAQVNARWLDSARSLMEQGITEQDTIFLRYKYSTFFNLDPKCDAARINLIYQQARWSLLTETVLCTDEEMLLFAALQLHVIKHQSETSAVDDVTQNSLESVADCNEDDVDAALNELQMSLEGQNNGQNKKDDVTLYPELKDVHMVLKPKKMTFNRYKRRYCVFKDTTLSIYRNNNDTNSLLMSVNVKGCIVRGEADVGTGKFVIRLTALPSSSEQSCEIVLSQNNMEKHGTWLAAFLTASRRHTMANFAFTSELESVLSLLSLRQVQMTNRRSGDADNVDEVLRSHELEDFVADRVLRKTKRNQVLRRISEIASNLNEMSATEAKLTFIKAWQTLPDSSLAFFVVTFKGSTRKDLIAVGVDRLLHMDLNTGQCLRAWPYNKMRSWAVNWNTEQVKIEQLGEASDSEISFKCHSADCKAVHEYIGGYVFLTMRSLDKNQTLDEKLFQKLTGGRQ